MLLKKALLASVLAVGLLSPAILRAEEGGAAPHDEGFTRADYEKDNNTGLTMKAGVKADRGTGTESEAWRGRFGGYSAAANGGRANRANDPYKSTAYDAQKMPNENTKSIDLIGIKTKEANVFEGAKKMGPCDVSYKALGVQGGLSAGIASTTEIEEGGKKGETTKGLSCQAGVEGTLISGKIDCKKQLAGNEDLGADVKGGGEAGAKANLSCKCNGASVICEAMIGVKAGVDGSIGGTLCGLRLGIGGSADVGAGAGARAQIGKTANGYGFSIGAYVGVGAGVGLSIDPKLDGLLQGKTYTCLAQKGKAVLGFLGKLGSGLGKILAKVGEAQMAAAQSGAGVFLTP